MFRSKAVTTGLQSILRAYETNSAISCAGIIASRHTQAAADQSRHYSSVPEYWGRKSQYTEGTEFLGTPPNHLDLVAKRPLSPHVFEIDGKQLHYKMPLAALSSITNRATGVMLSLGAGGVGYIALTGDLGAAITAFKSSYPLLVFPAKFAVAFPMVYHYAAGVRHLWWDAYKYGNQADKHSPLEIPSMEQSSKIMIGVSAALTAVLGVYSL